MPKALPSIAALAAGVLAALPAAAQRGPYDGTYEYAAPGWRGLLEVATASDGTTHFAINTQNDGRGCSLFGTARLSDNTITLRGAGGGSLILRFFEGNAEIEAAGSTDAFCDAGAQLGGIYIQTASTIDFDRDDVRTAQRQLNKLGYEVGPIDGVMGRRTRQALAAFQRQNGLADAGELSLETLYRLNQRVDQATESAAAPTGPAPADAGRIATEPALAVDLAPRIDWLAEVPRVWIPALDRLYGAEVPARIDWSNPPFELAVLDLDRQPTGGQNQDELLVFWNDVNFCGDRGCTFEVLRFRDGAYAPVLQTVAKEVRLAADHDNGARGLIIDGEPWTWNGNAYVQEVYEPTRVR